MRETEFVISKGITEERFAVILGLNGERGISCHTGWLQMMCMLLYVKCKKLAWYCSSTQHVSLGFHVIILRLCISLSVCPLSESNRGISMTFLGGELFLRNWQSLS